MGEVQKNPMVRVMPVRAIEFWVDEYVGFRIYVIGKYHYTFYVVSLLAKDVEHGELLELAMGGGLDVLAALKDAEETYENSELNEPGGENPFTWLLNNRFDEISKLAWKLEAEEDISNSVLN